MTITALPTGAQSKPGLWVKSKQSIQELTKGKGLQKQTFPCQGKMKILAKNEHPTLTGETTPGTWHKLYTLERLHNEDSYRKVLL